MGTAWVHRLSDLDVEARRATCSECGPNARIKNMGVRANGLRQWRCAAARAVYDYKRKRPHRLLLGDRCEDCGFTHEDVRLLDVHHMNGDNTDNRKSNLRTLCPLCHRKRHYGIK